MPLVSFRISKLSRLPSVFWQSFGSPRARAPDHVHQGLFGGSTLGFFQSLSPQGAAGMCLHGLSMGIPIRKMPSIGTWLDQDGSSIRFGTHFQTARKIYKNLRCKSSQHQKLNICEHQKLEVVRAPWCSGFPTALLNEIAHVGLLLAQA